LFTSNIIFTGFTGVIVKGETMYSYGETERQCVFYGETMYFYGKHNLYLDIKNFFKLKVLIKSDLTLTNE
jgi:hypothetical protein